MVEVRAYSYPLIRPIDMLTTAVRNTSAPCGALLEMHSIRVSTHLHPFFLSSELHGQGCASSAAGNALRRTWNPPYEQTVPALGEHAM